MVAAADLPLNPAHALKHELLEDQESLQCLLHQALSNGWLWTNLRHLAVPIALALPERQRVLWTVSFIGPAGQSG